MSAWAVMKDAGDAAARLEQLVLDLETAHSRHPHIQNQAAGTIGEGVSQEFLRGFKQLGAQAHAFQQAPHRRAHVAVIVNDEDHGWRRGAHEWTGTAQEPSFGMIQQRFQSI